MGTAARSQLNAGMPASIEIWRKTLITLAPKLDETAVSLARNNSDYERFTQVPLGLLNHLSGGSSEGIEDTCRGYVSFCDTFYDKQVEFARTQQYRASSYEQVNSDVYQNPEYMARVYYPALLLSYLFSSNYFHIYRVFCERFVPLVKDASGQCCEIGIGHGLLSGTLLSRAAALTGYGLDISPVAVEVTQRVSAFFGLESPILTQVADATQSIPLANGNHYNVMICAEVLEHLPDPAKLLCNMRSALADDGALFLTASINMESVDHLYLFHSDEEVVRMVENCGFEVAVRDLAFLTVASYRDNPEICRKLMVRRNPATAILIAKKSAHR